MECLCMFTCDSEACVLNMCHGSPKQLLGLVFTRRTHKTQHVVVPTDKTNSSERVQSKASKEEKGHGVKSGGYEAQASKNPLQSM